MLLVTGCDVAANKVVIYEQGHRVSACQSSCHHLSLLHVQVQHKTRVLQMSLHHLCGSLIVSWSGSLSRVVSGYFSPLVSFSSRFPVNILSYVLYFSLFSGCCLLSSLTSPHIFSFLSLHCSDSVAIWYFIVLFLLCFLKDVTWTDVSASINIQMSMKNISWT